MLFDDSITRRKRFLGRMRVHRLIGERVAERHLLACRLVRRKQVRRKQVCQLMFTCSGAAPAYLNSQQIRVNLRAPGQPLDAVCQRRVSLGGGKVAEMISDFRISLRSGPSSFRHALNGFRRLVELSFEL